VAAERGVRDRRTSEFRPGRSLPTNGCHNTARCTAGHSHPVAKARRLGEISPDALHRQQRNGSAARRV